MRSRRKCYVQDRESRMLEKLATWLVSVYLVWGEATSPIFGLIAVFMGWKMFFRKRQRIPGLVCFTTGVVVTLAGFSNLAAPGKLGWLYACFRDLNPFS